MNSQHLLFKIACQGKQTKKAKALQMQSKIHSLQNPSKVRHFLDKQNLLESK